MVQDSGKQGMVLGSYTKMGPACQLGVPTALIHTLLLPLDTCRAEVDTECHEHYFKFGEHCLVNDTDDQTMVVEIPAMFAVKIQGAYHQFIKGKEY